MNTSYSCYLSPKQPRSCGLLHIVSIFKKKHAKKKKKPEWKKEKKQKQNAFRLYTDVGPLPGRTTERRPYHVRRVAMSSCA